MAHPALALRPDTSDDSREVALTVGAKRNPQCPACGGAAQAAILRVFASHQLRECAECSLQFWELPADAQHESAWLARERRAERLTAGQRMFLRDPLAPSRGRLLDVQCGTGVFLRAAAKAGFAAMGIETNCEAARFASGHCPRGHVFTTPLEYFAARHPRERFDVATLFGTLAQHASPNRLLAQVRERLLMRGFLAVTVTNGRRWERGDEAAEPSERLQWNAAALRNLLRTNGFSVVSLRTVAPGVAYTAEQFGRGGRWNRAAYLPAAMLAMPWVRWQRLAGPELYCLARKLD